MGDRNVMADFLARRVANKISYKIVVIIIMLVNLISPRLFY